MNFIFHLHQITKSKVALFEISRRKPEPKYIDFMNFKEKQLLDCLFPKFDILGTMRMMTPPRSCCLTAALSPLSSSPSLSCSNSSNSSRVVPFPSLWSHFHYHPFIIPHLRSLFHHYQSVKHVNFLATFHIWWFTNFIILLFSESYQYCRSVSCKISVSLEFGLNKF